MRLLPPIALGLLLLILAVAACNTRGGPVPPPAAGALRVVTMNVHYILLDAKDDDPWSVAGWQRRRAAMVQVLASLDADLIAFQEMETFQRGNDGSVNLARDDLLAAMPGFALAASGDWRRFPSTQPIFYRKDRLRLLDQGLVLLFRDAGRDLLAHLQWLLPRLRLVGAIRESSDGPAAARAEPAF